MLWFKLYNRFDTLYYIRSSFSIPLFVKTSVSIHLNVLYNSRNCRPISMPVLFIDSKSQRKEWAKKWKRTNKGGFPAKKKEHTLCYADVRELSKDIFLRFELFVCFFFFTQRKTTYGVIILIECSVIEVWLEFRPWSG